MKKMRRELSLVILLILVFLLGMFVGKRMATQRPIPGQDSLLTKASAPNQGDQLPPQSAQTEDSPFMGPKEWEKDLLSLSGIWKSADGECTATIDFREIRFAATGRQADLNDGLFLLGESMDFITRNGYYSININPENNDEIGLAFTRKNPEPEESEITLHRQK